MGQSSKYSTTLDISCQGFYNGYIYKIIMKSSDRIADALERIANILESNVHISIDHGHIEAIDHAHIDDIGEIHGDVITHPKAF